MTTAHTPTPWEISENAYGCFFIKYGEGRAMNLIAGGNNHDTLSGENAAHIVKCVNLHEELVEALKKCGSLLEYGGFDMEFIDKALKKADAL